MTARDEQAALWCMALAEGELPEAERSAFDRWLADPVNADAFGQAAAAWNAVEEAADAPAVIGMRGAALRDYHRAGGRETGRQRRRWRVWAAVAAALLLALTGLVLHAAPDRYRTGVGERRIVVLADGSRLSLDADTAVDVRLADDRRALTLVRGRAKFDVAHDPLRPFSVAAGDKLVVATGTAFAVEMLAKQMRVQLYEGHVAVLDDAGERPVASAVPGLAADQRLVPGRQLTATLTGSAPARLSVIDPQRALGWEVGQIGFDDEPLATAVERMNRYSPVPIAIAPGAGAAIRVDGVFAAGDSNAFVEGVTRLYPLRAVRQGERIILAPR